MTFKCDGTCPGNELGDCYGEDWHKKADAQTFTRKQVERIIDLVNNDRKPPSDFVAECIDQVAAEG